MLWAIGLDGLVEEICDLVRQQVFQNLLIKGVGPLMEWQCEDCNIALICLHCRTFLVRPVLQPAGLLELPDHVILTMLHRDVHLSNAKLKALEHDYDASVRKIGVLNGQIGQVRTLTHCWH